MFYPLLFIGDVAGFLIIRVKRNDLIPFGFEGGCSSGRGARPFRRLKWLRQRGAADHHNVCVDFANTHFLQEGI